MKDYLLVAQFTDGVQTWREYDRGARESLTEDINIFLNTIGVATLTIHVASPDPNAE